MSLTASLNNLAETEPKPEPKINNLLEALNTDIVNVVEMKQPVVAEPAPEFHPQKNLGNMDMLLQAVPVQPEQKAEPEQKTMSPKLDTFKVNVEVEPKIEDD
jgi:hypothetical protein